MKPLVITIALALTGCAKDAPPAALGLKPPVHLLHDCKDIPDIPPNDGDKAERTKYYAITRDQYAACKENNHGLRLYAETVSKETSP